MECLHWNKKWTKFLWFQRLSTRNCSYENYCISFECNNLQLNFSCWKSVLLCWREFWTFRYFTETLKARTGKHQLVIFRFRKKYTFLPVYQFCTFKQTLISILVISKEQFHKERIHLKLFFVIGYKSRVLAFQ